MHNARIIVAVIFISDYELKSRKLTGNSNGIEYYEDYSN